MALPLAYNFSLNGGRTENKLENNLLLVQSVKVATILNLEYSRKQGLTLGIPNVTVSKH